MKKGNVLVIGNSGVGKSTLINAVLGENRAKTGYGATGITSALEVYESKELPFRIIDTIGFEPTFIKEQKAINAVKKWSKNSAKDGNENSQINVIWFCVDGTARKLFPKAIDSLARATSLWKTVPVITVITKSYSVPERKENIEMVQNTFNLQKKHAKNLKSIIPVVAQTYSINDTAFAPPDGIAELIDATNKLMPEGIKAASYDLANFKLGRKKAFAQSIVGISTASAIAIGAVPLSIADAALLTPLEIAEINAIAKVYGIKNDAQSKQFLNQIVEVGTVGIAAKTAIAALKNIPGIGLSAAALNAVIAGSIVAALGEGSIYAFEQVYLGNKTLNDLDWLRKLLESKLSTEFIQKVKSLLENSNGSFDPKAMIDTILELFITPQK